MTTYGDNMTTYVHDLALHLLEGTTIKLGILCLKRNQLFFFSGLRNTLGYSFSAAASSIILYLQCYTSVFKISTCLYWERIQHFI